mgnify:CR=1 FL=1
MNCNKCNGRGEIPARPFGLGDLFSYTGPMKKCPKCKGTGQFNPSSSSGGSHSGGSSHQNQPKKESAWREKSCPGYSGYCGTTIKYRTDWDNIPNLCPSCKQKETPIGLNDLSVSGRNDLSVHNRPRSGWKNPAVDRSAEI